MEKNQVLLTLDEYNELRDVKKELEKGNIVGFVVRSCGDRDMYFYTENAVIKKFETQNDDLEKRRCDLLLQLTESQTKLTESQNTIRELRLENGKLHNKIKELEIKPAFSIRNFIFGWKKK